MSDLAETLRSKVLLRSVLSSDDLWSLRSNGYIEVSHANITWRIVQTDHDLDVVSIRHVPPYKDVWMHRGIWPQRAMPTIEDGIVAMYLYLKYESRAADQVACNAGRAVYGW